MPRLGNIPEGQRLGPPGFLHLNLSVKLLRIPVIDRMTASGVIVPVAHVATIFAKRIQGCVVQFFYQGFAFFLCASNPQSFGDLNGNAKNIKILFTLSVSESDTP